MSTTTAYTAHFTLLLLLLVSSLMVRYLTLACDIDKTRRSSTQNVPGGWSGVAVDDNSVVQLKQTVANDNIVVAAHHVVESYQQVVNGINYCIKFSASANCSTHQCQSVECVAGGYQPLPVDGQQQPVQRRSLTCTQMNACNIASARASAATPMPGGWHSVDNSSEYISQLYDNAALIAAVRPGVVHESYSQIVAGVNFCIQFDSTGSANCHQQCQALSCVAAGFLPLNVNASNPGVVSMIGVRCQPGGILEGYTGNSASTSMTATITSLMTSFVLFTLVRVLGSL